MGTAILFPGQGSQQVGMGADIFEKSPTAQSLFKKADNILGYSLSQICFEGPEDRLTDTVNQQPALFTTSLAYWTALKKEEDISPNFLAGHSLGEFSALVAAESLSFEDGLILVQKRGELMKKAGELAPGGMAAILAIDVSTGKEICKNASKETGFSVQLANDNCPGQIVISGHEEGLTRAMSLAEAAGARKIVRLPISIAAHSKLMESIADEFSIALDSTTIHPSKIPVVGNVSALPLKNPNEIRLELKNQLTSLVAWTDSIQYLVSQGVDTFIEVGPGQVLLGLVKRIDRKVKRVPVKI